MKKVRKNKDGARLKRLFSPIANKKNGHSVDFFCEFNVFFVHMDFYCIAFYDQVIWQKNFHFRIIMHLDQFSTGFNMYPLCFHEKIEIREKIVA